MTDATAQPPADQSAIESHALPSRFALVMSHTTPKRGHRNWGGEFMAEATDMVEDALGTETPYYAVGVANFRPKHPEGLDWGDYPVIDVPRWTIGGLNCPEATPCTCGHWGNVADGRVVRHLELSEVVRAPERFVVLEGVEPLESAMLADVAASVLSDDDAAWERPVLVISGGDRYETTLRKLASEQRLATARMESWFHYNWATNFTAVCGRALAKIGHWSSHVPKLEPSSLLTVLLAAEGRLRVERCGRWDSWSKAGKEHLAIGPSDGMRQTPDGWAWSSDPFIAAPTITEWDTVILSGPSHLDFFALNSPFPNASRRAFSLSEAGRKFVETLPPAADVLKFPSLMARWRQGAPDDYVEAARWLEWFFGTWARNLTPADIALSSEER